MDPASRPTLQATGTRLDRQPGEPPLPAISYERYPGAASAPLPFTYRRREPEKSVLHTVVREHLETFLDQASRLHGQGYPHFIEREFRRTLGCGDLSRGFARLRCPRLIYRHWVLTFPWTLRFRLATPPRQDTRHP